MGLLNRSIAPQLLEGQFKLCSDLAARALLSALLGAHLDGQDHVLGALGAPEEDGPSTACMAGSHLRLHTNIPRWLT